MTKSCDYCGHEHCNAGLQRYDISTDSMVPLTQEHYDALELRLQRMIGQQQPLPVGKPASIPAGLKLACFANPMRIGQVFIAEAKEIEPYKDEDGRAIIAGNGKPYYPAVPQTEWIIRGDVNQDFASELVRRWNSPVWEKETTIDD